MPPVVVAAKLIESVPGLSEEARDIADQQSATEFLRELEESDLYRDATLFVAGTMPIRDAIWWGCLCCEHAFAGRNKKPAQAALLETGHWLLRPEGINAARLDQLAESASPDTASGALAKAAAFIASAPDAPPDSVEMQGAIRLVAASVLLAAGSSNDVTTNLRQYLAVGVEVSQGKLSWQ